VRVHRRANSGQWPEVRQVALGGASQQTRCEMLIDYVLGGAVTLFITAYLIYALLRPERF